MLQILLIAGDAINIAKEIRHKVGDTTDNVVDGVIDMAKGILLF